MPLVVNGVVFVASTDGKTYAFPEDCDATPVCSSLFVEAAGDLPQTPAMWENRILYTVVANGTLTAYTVDGTQP